MSLKLMELREPRLDASEPRLEAKEPRLLLDDTVRELADRLDTQTTRDASEKKRTQICTEEQLKD